MMAPALGGDGDRRSRSAPTGARYRADVAAPDSSPVPRRVHEYVGLSAGSVALLVGAAVVAWLLQGAFVDAHRPLGWVVACTVVALLIDPLVRALDRYLPRALAIVAVLLAVLGMIALVGIGVGREVYDSLDELTTRAPEAAAEMEARYSWAADVDLAERVGGFVEEIDGRIRDDAVSRAADRAPTYLVTGILMLFLLAGGRRYLDAFVDQFTEPRRSRWRGVVVAAAAEGRQWLLWSIAVGIAVGTVVGLVAWGLGLPAAVSLGVVAGVLAIVPFIGTLVGGLPAALLAFGLDGWRSGALVVIVLVALQAADATWARRWIERRSVRVGATVPILGALVGFEIYDGGGAVYAVALGVIGLAAVAAVVQEGADGRPEPAAPTG